MAKFRLMEGEQVIERKRVRNVAGELRDDYELILTERRIVVTRTRRPALGAIFGILGALIGEGFKDTRIEYEIVREKFGSAEATSNNELDVRSTGEGYLLIHFDVRIKDAAAWAERLQRWGAGEASEVATATVVKR
jgi:hypothetical protein